MASVKHPFSPVTVKVTQRKRITNRLPAVSPDTSISYYFFKYMLGFCGLDTALSIKYFSISVVLLTDHLF